MSGDKGKVSPHHRESYKGETRYQKKVREMAEKLATVDAFITPESQAARRRRRVVDANREWRKRKRLWG